MPNRKIEEFLGEFLGYWCGALNPSTLAAVLGTTREACSRGIFKVMRANRGYAFEKLPGKQHLVRITDPDSLKQCPSSPFGLVGILGAQRLMDAAGQQHIQFEDTYSLSAPEPDVDVFNTLCRATSQKRTVSGIYLRKNGMFHATFSPHTLVKTGARLHFRGNLAIPGEGKSGYFIDLVPSRFKEIELGGPEEYIDETGDVPWNTRVDLHFSLSEALPEKLRAVVHQEWDELVKEKKDSGTASMVLTVRDVRQALALYVKRDLQTRVFGSEYHEVWIPLE